MSQEKFNCFKYYVIKISKVLYIYYIIMHIYNFEKIIHVQEREESTIKKFETLPIISKCHVKLHIDIQGV